MIRALPAALILRFAGFSIFGDLTLKGFRFCLAHLALWAAAMAALPASDIPPFFGPRLPGVLTVSSGAGTATGADADKPNNSDSSAFSRSICPAMPAALVNWVAVKSNKLMVARL